jgi:DNA-binding HxlR family transcriptional regulator
MRQTSYSQMHCSLARSLEVMGDWWTPLILRDVYLGVRRFDDLAEDLGISRNLLSSRLRSLIDDGLVERRRYHERPPRDEFVLSEAGRELAPILMALTAWGDRWVAPAQGPPIRFQHQGCGEFFTPQVACSHCGEPITAAEVTTHPGPGARAVRGTKLLAKRLPPRHGASSTA